MSKRNRPATHSEVFDDDDISQLKPERKRTKLRHDEPEASEPSEGRLAVKNGFRILPVRLHGLPFYKYWYFREQKHSFDDADANAASADSEASRSLFVTNIGLDCSENDLRAAFSVCGAIEAVRCVPLIRSPVRSADSP